MTDSEYILIFLLYVTLILGLYGLRKFSRNPDPPLWQGIAGGFAVGAISGFILVLIGILKS